MDAVTTELVEAEHKRDQRYPSERRPLAEGLMVPMRLS